MKKGLTYNDVYVCMALLGDALQLSLPKKALSEVLMLRAHYGKGVKEFDEAKKQIVDDASKGKDPEKDKEAIEAAVKEPIEAKAKEEAGIASRPLSAGAFEEICGAATEAGNIRSGLFPAPAEGEAPEGVPALLWLETLAYNLTE